MPANERNARVGAENRAKIIAALKSAGDEGFSTEELANFTRMCVKAIAFYCRTTPQQILRVGLTTVHYVRWFHVDHKEGAEAYQQALQNRPHRERKRWAQATRDQALSMILSAGSGGVAGPAIATTLDMNLNTVRSMLSEAAAEGLIQRTKRDRGIMWYYPTGVELPTKVRKRKSKAKPKELHKKPGPKLGSTRLPKPQSKPQMTVRVKSAVIDRDAQIIIPANVKRTACPSCTDNRFTVHQPEPYFSAMKPGQYAPGETWAGAVYGGAT